MTLHLSSFGGGVALVGSADTERTDELLACDSYDLGERGQLIVASDISNFAQSVVGTPAGGFGTLLYGITPAGTAQDRYLLIVGEAVRAGANGMQTWRYSIPALTQQDLVSGNARAQGALVTFAAFPFVDRLGVQQRPTLICIAPRETEDPRTGNGLFVHHDSGGGLVEDSGAVFDWLGTGTGQFNEATAGTNGKALFPRGVAAYNNHVMLWGFDSRDATKGDGPNRLMFSNVGNPFKIGNDPGPVGVDRAFLDTDAVNIGGSGEIIRAGYPWAGKFWIGTNRELHYLAGFGRDSFTTNGTVNIRKSHNVTGPNAIIEGPDGLLYGVSTEGLWGFDGAAVEPLYRRLVDFRGKSLGWWDLIWQDTTRGTAYPGQTNQDLLWMLADPDVMQVWIVIPWCNAAAGYGYGTDTVIIKYHTETRGFTRQVIIGKQLTHGTILRRETASPKRVLMLQSQAVVVDQNLREYGAKANQSVSPIVPTALPDVTFGDYSPFSPDEKGLQRRIYITVSWDNAAALPIVFLATPSVDGEALAAVQVSIQPAAPGAPADTDLWLDTSGTDQNIGTGIAGAIIPAAADYVLKRWVASWGKWVAVPKGGSEIGTRVTFPIAYKGLPGDRHRFRLQTTALSGRYQIESIGLDPARDKK